MKVCELILALRAVDPALTVVIASAESGMEPADVDVEGGYCVIILHDEDA